MSIMQTRQVRGLVLPRNEREVLFSLADHACEDGSRSFPSVGLIAWETDYSERQVQRLLAALEARGLIETVANSMGGRGHTKEYQLHLEKGIKKSPFISLKGDISDTKGDISGVKGDIQESPFISSFCVKGDSWMSPFRANEDEERVTFEVVKGDISGLKGDIAMSIKGDIAMSPDPSIEPSMEPSFIARDKKEKKQPSRASPDVTKSAKLTEAPDDFELTPERVAWAKKAGFRGGEDHLLAVTANFLDHHTAKGTRFKDWSRSWQTWIRNSVTYGQDMPRGGNGNGKAHAGMANGNGRRETSVDRDSRILRERFGLST